MLVQQVPVVFGLGVGIRRHQPGERSNFRMDGRLCAEQVLTAAPRVGCSRLTLLDEPGFTCSAMGDAESSSALQPESGRNRGDAGSHLSRSG